MTIETIQTTTALIRALKALRDETREAHKATEAMLAHVDRYIAALQHELVADTLRVRREEGQV